MNERCDICNSIFNRGYNVPKKLPCGHTYCLICMFKELVKYQNFACKECPETIETERELRCIPVDDSKLISKFRNIEDKGKIIEEKIYKRPQRLDSDEEFDSGFFSGKKSGRRNRGYEGNETVKRIGESVFVSKRGVFIEKEEFLKRQNEFIDNDFNNQRIGSAGVQSMKKRSRKRDIKFFSVRKINDEKNIFGDVKRINKQRKNYNFFAPPEDDFQPSEFVKWHSGLDIVGENMSEESSHQKMKIEFLTCLVPSCLNHTVYDFKDPLSRFCSIECAAKWPDFPNGKPPE